MTLLPIVEGHGEMHAVPLLLRRILHEVLQVYNVQVLPPQRRGELPKVRADFERMFRTALLEQAPILWIMDFDCDDCVDWEQDRAHLVRRAAAIDPRARFDVVFIVQEFESMFLADPSGVRRRFREISEASAFPTDFESIRDAKGTISRLLPSGRSYKPTIDQTAIVAHLDLERLGRLSPSYQRIVGAVRRLVID